MLRDVPPHLQDRQCNSEPADTGAIAWPHVLQPAKQGPGSGVVSVPQAGHRALRSADTDSFQVPVYAAGQLFHQIVQQRDWSGQPPTVPPGQQQAVHTCAGEGQPEQRDHVSGVLSPAWQT